MSGDPVRMHNPTHRHEDIRVPEFKDGPTVGWETEVRGTRGLAVRDNMCIAAVDQGVVALRADGTPEWRFTAAGSYTVPTVGERSVYVTSADSTEDGYGRLHALDIESGSEKWRFELRGKGGKTSPAVVGDTVYIANGGAEAVYALEAETGTPRWAVDDVGPAYKSLAVVDNTVYVGTQGRVFDDNDGSVCAIDADTGTVQWELKTDDKIASPPTVTNGTVYTAGRSGSVYAIDSDAGNKNWEYTTGDTVESSPAVVGGTVYVGSDEAVYALDATIGTVAWRFETSSTVRSSPLVTDETVYVGSTDGSIYALAAGDGSKRWQFSLRKGDTSPFAAHVSAGPVAVDGTICVATTEAIYGLSSKAGGQHSTEPKRLISAEGSRHCSSCESDLSEYGSPNFCPECGAKQ